MQPPTSQPYVARVIVWAAMLFSIVTYYVVARMVTPVVTRDLATLVNVLLVAAVGMVAGSFGVKSFFTQRARQVENPNLVRAGELIAITMCEAASLFGLVSWFATATPHYYWFLLLGAAGMLLHFPQRES